MRYTCWGNQTPWKPETITGTPGRTPKTMARAGDPSIIRGVIGQIGTNVTVYGYSKYNTRMDPTMTGGEYTVRRIDPTEEGVTTLTGGSKKNGGLAVGHTTASYP